MIILKRVTPAIHKQKQAYVDEINLHKKDINLRNICESIGINYKQFLAGYRGDFNRISVKSLAIFVDAMQEELQFQKDSKALRIYKCYFDLNANLHQKEKDYTAILEYTKRLQYLLDNETTQLTKEEIAFLKQECKKANLIIKQHK